MEYFFFFISNLPVAKVTGSLKSDLLPKHLPRAGHNFFANFTWRHKMIGSINFKIGRCLLILVITSRIQKFTRFENGHN